MKSESNHPPPGPRFVSVARETGLDLGEAKHLNVDPSDSLEEPEVGWIWVPGSEEDNNEVLD